MSVSGRCFVRLGVVGLAFVGLGLRAGAQQGVGKSSLLVGCGAAETQFKTENGAAGDSEAPEAADRATVYVIEVYNINDKGHFNRPTLRVGMDGAWMGATKGFSFLRFAAESGERHVCARWQSRFNSLAQQVSLLNFKAEAGRTYYLRVQINVEGASEGSAVSIDLQPVSEDEGRFLVSEAARSISHPE